MSAQEAKEKLIIFGGGGHGRTLIEVVRAMGVYEIHGIVDDNMEPGQRFLDVPVLGGEAMLPGLIEAGVHLAVNGVGGIGNPQVRWQVFERLEEYGFHFPTIVHPSAAVDPSVELAAGVQVLHLAHIGSESVIGKGSVINVHAVLCHDAKVGLCTNFSPGALVAGNVTVGDFSQVGMGATININLKVGSRVLIGNNATVKADVPDGTRVRAGTIYPLPPVSRLGTAEDKGV